MILLPDCLFRSPLRAVLPRLGGLLLLLLPALLLGAGAAQAQSNYDREAQNREYQRLQDATRRAYSVPDQPASPSRPYQSPTTPSSGSRSTNGSSGGSAPNLQPLSSTLQRLSNSMNRTPAERPKSPGFGTDPRLRSNQAANGSTPSAPVPPPKTLTYSEIVAARYQGSTRPECDGNCQETLTLTDGSGTYMGNTRLGWPQGIGILTRSSGERVIATNFNQGDPVGYVRVERADGAVYVGGYNAGYEGNTKVDKYWGLGKLSQPNGDYDEGIFDRNQLNGMGLRVRGGQAEMGLWRDGQPIGPRTTGPASLATQPRYLALMSGSVFEGLVRDGRLLKGKITYPGNGTFEGTFSQTDSYNFALLGRRAFANGHTFEGEIRYDNPFHGTYTCPAYVFTGELFYGYVGRVSFAATKHTVFGTFLHTDELNADPAALDKRCVGYCQDRLPDGNRTERVLDGASGPQPPTRYTRPTGEVITGLSRPLSPENPYQFVGLSTMKAAPETIIAPKTASKTAPKTAPKTASKAAAAQVPPATAPPALTKAVAQNAAGEWLTLPETELPAATEAARTATEALDQARAAYNQKVAWNPKLVL